jgi:hypothetical protein
MISNILRDESVSQSRLLCYIAARDPASSIRHTRPREDLVNARAEAIASQGFRFQGFRCDLERRQIGIPPEVLFRFAWRGQRAEEAVQWKDVSGSRL